MNKINRFILCVIDDVRAEHFFDFINKGLLPTFKKLMENGIYSDNCITDFPSVTFPTHVSIITGTYTGDYRRESCHGVPLYNWMGRDTSPPYLRCYGSRKLQIYKINEDMGRKCKTILEMVGEENTTSISQFINRGTKYFFPENKIKLIYYYLLIKHSRNLKKMMARANTMVIYKLLENFKKPKNFFGNNEPPLGSLIWFVSSDILMHLFGYDSQLYISNLIHIDKVMGILLDNLEKMGYLNDTALAITADHGNYGAKKVGDLNNFFIRNNLTHYHPIKRIKANMNLAEFGAVGFFNFKGSKTTPFKYGWTHPTLKEMESYGPKRVNLFKELFKIEGTCLMYHRDDDNTYKKGKILIKRKCKKIGKIISGAIEYRGTSTNFQTKYLSENDDEDVFGYLSDKVANKMVNNKFHSIQEWMDATHHLDFPIYPDLISRHFKNPRSSDIIISTDGSVVYNITHGKKKNNNKYSHDIGLRNSSIVPLIIGGSPEIPQKEIFYCKSTDIVPTLLKMLGKKPHESVIGKSLI